MEDGDDIILPNIDMCLIMLAGWFNKSLPRGEHNFNIIYRVDFFHKATMAGLTN